MERKRISPTFDIDTYNQIFHIASKKNIAMSEQIRIWAEEGLNGEVSRENIDLITKIIRNELKNILDPKIERLAKIGSKACVQSSAAVYLTAETISSLLPPEAQQNFNEVYELAKKKGVLYLKNKAEDVEQE